MILSGTFANSAATLYGYSWEDIHLLAKIIHAEARGEGLQGMIAVGAVVMNRVKDPSFPNTIEEVIFQPRQFSAIGDGQFQLEPNELAYEAAMLVLQGKDPTEGCLFFYNPTISTAAWSFQRTTEVIIGNHHFTR